jgi:hypothetical protein
MAEAPFTSDIHMALSLFAKNKGLAYPYRSPKQLGRRIVADLSILTEAGFDVVTQKGHAGYTKYTFLAKEAADEHA